MIHTRRENIPADVLEEIVTLGEGYKTEFKATLPSPLFVARSLSAFSNDNGGNLFVGINDSSLPVGVINTDYELTKLEKALEFVVPSPDVAVKSLMYKECEILLVEVKEGSDKPYYVKHGLATQAYVRAGPANIAASKRALRKFLGGHGDSDRAGALNKDEKIVIDLFSRSPRLELSQIRETLNYSERRTRKVLETLARRGLLVHSANEKNVYNKTAELSR